MTTTTKKTPIPLTRQIENCEKALVSYDKKIATCNAKIQMYTEKRDTVVAAMTKKKERTARIRNHKKTKASTIANNEKYIQRREPLVVAFNATINKYTTRRDQVLGKRQKKEATLARKRAKYARQQGTTT